MRLSVDVGGTFTDLMFDTGGGNAAMFKAATTYPDPIDGVLDVLRIAAAAEGSSLAAFLGRAELLFHSTTRAINAVITGTTARTALLVTEGHPDILLIREGGRSDPFNYHSSYPEPYIPRSLTIEVPERIGADGRVVSPLTEREAHAVVARLVDLNVEAVAVSLLWSIINPDHELLLGRVLRERLPEVPFTLSHQLNPVVREYRRTSSCAINASLMPIMSHYLRSLQHRLRDHGLRGALLAVTSQGGVLDIQELAHRPILALNSGPSMAPVAGRHFATLEGARTAIVTDAGGTTYDISLVRDGVIPWTRDTWIGPVYQGHLTGFPSVDVKSVGAGGGSIAVVDAAGLLRVGPESAGSVPGPACYDRGGRSATVTDAALVLGYIDPASFLGGSMILAVEKARALIETEIAKKLGLSVEEAAVSIIEVATENMVHAIADITVKQGIDPADTVMIGGGGAAGLNAVAIGRRLNCERVVFPQLGATMSAAGAMMSELTTEVSATCFMTSSSFDLRRANEVLTDLARQSQDFFLSSGAFAAQARIDLSVEARYPSQVWEIDVPLRGPRFENEAGVAELVADFHHRHNELFSFRDDGDEVEIMSWRAVARCNIAGNVPRVLAHNSTAAAAPQRRTVYFRDRHFVEVAVKQFDDLADDVGFAGPAIVESSYTSVVINPGAEAVRRPGGYLLVFPNGRQAEDEEI
jgi:N-methylhydantoinase A